MLWYVARMKDLFSLRLFTFAAPRLPVAAYALLALFALVVFLPGFFTLPPLDRDESLFAQSTKQMMETGHYADIHFQNEARYKKPIGIYWLQAGAVKLWQAMSGDTHNNLIWPYRIPSLLGAVAAVLLTAAIGARFFGAQTGFMAGVFLALSLLLNAEARMAKTDAVLLASILAAMAVLAKAYCRRGYARILKGRDVVVFWAALAVGVLIKGPLIFIPVLGVLALLALWKDPLSWLWHLKPLVGLPLFLLITAPWFFFIISHAGDEFIKQSISRDFLAKIFEGQNWGGALPGYHAVMAFLMFWPASLVFFLGLPTIWQRRREPLVRFLLAWLLPVWLSFELTLTKLPHYVLPAYPALAILAAFFITASAQATWRGWQKNLIGLFWILVTVGLCAVPIILPVLVEKHLSYAGLFLGSLAVGGGVASFILFRKDKNIMAAIPLPLAGFALMLALFGFTFPNLSSVFISNRIVDALPLLPDCPRVKIATAGYNEPSLVFLAGQDTAMINNAEDIVPLMAQDRCLVAVVDAQQEERMRLALTKNNHQAEKRFTMSGFNYARGKPLTLFFYY